MAKTLLRNHVEIIQRLKGQPENVIKTLRRNILTQTETDLLLEKLLQITEKQTVIRLYFQTPTIKTTNLTI